MISRIIYPWLFLLLAAGLSSTVWPTELPGGIGGTGLVESMDGIGGTGYVPDPDEGEGGIGGTGVLARSEEGGIGGTGIVGVITGFGSVIVNGVHVDYDADMRVYSALGDASTDDLKVGQVVSVEADQAGERYHARRLDLHHPVAGPVTDIDLKHGILTVMKQRVSVSEEGGANGIDLQDIQLGDRVAVSGLWDGDLVQATRLDRRGNVPAVLAGPVSRIVDGRVFVGGMPVRFASGSPPEGLAVGREVQLIGVERLDELEARMVRMEPQTPFDGRMRQLILEGYPRSDAGAMRLRGLLLKDGGVESGRRQIVTGDLESGQRLRLRNVRLSNPARPAMDTKKPATPQTEGNRTRQRKQVPPTPRPNRVRKPGTPKHADKHRRPPSRPVYRPPAHNNRPPARRGMPPRQGPWQWRWDR